MRRAERAGTVIAAIDAASSPVKSGSRYILGFFPRTTEVRYGLGGALERSFRDNWHATSATLTALPRLVTSYGDQARYSVSIIFPAVPPRKRIPASKASAIHGTHFDRIGIPAAAPGFV